MFWVIIILLIIFFLYIHVFKKKQFNKDFMIKESKIHNLGLFANKEKYE